MVFLLRKPLGEALESVVRKVERQEYLIKISRHNQTPSEMMAVDNAMEHVPWPGGSGSRRLQFGRWHWNNSRYSTRVGLNEPRLDDDLFRVMNLGDSVCYGYGVEDDETFTHRMETRRPDIDFVNLAANGWDSGQQLGALESKIDTWKPGVVVVHYVPNDPVPHTVIDRPDRLFLHVDSWAKERLNTGWNRLITKAQHLLSLLFFEGMVAVLCIAVSGAVIGAIQGSSRLSCLSSKSPTWRDWTSGTRQYSQTTLGWIGLALWSMILMGLKPDITPLQRSFESRKFTRQDYQDVWRNPDGRFNRYLNRSRDALLEMKSICDARKIAMLLLYHAGLPTQGGAETIAETRVMQWCDEMEIPFLSYTERFKECGGFENFSVSLSDAHPNADGHRKIADWLLDDLSNQGLLPTDQKASVKSGPTLY